MTHKSKIIFQKSIKIKNVKLIKLQYFDDTPDGFLVIGESEKSIPFSIKRIYYINQLFNHQAVRGKHAHKNLQQILFCLNGSFTLSLNDGEEKQQFKLDNPYIGLKIGKMVWLEMNKFSSGCVILVLADDYYKEADYIRNYRDFLRLAKKNKQ